MEYLTQDISAFPLISFLIIAVLLYVFLRLLKRYLPLILKRKAVKVSFNRSFSIVELLIWISFLLWIIPLFLELNPAFGFVFSLVAFLAVLLIIWYAGRDFIAGFILRANIGFRVDTQISVGDYEGTIVEFYARNLRLLNDKGEKILIPYSKILGKPIRFHTPEKARISTRIQLEVKTQLKFDELVEQLRFQIMTHPKALINFQPKFNSISKGEGEFVLDIVLSARDAKGLSEIEYDLKKFVQEQIA